MAGSIRRNKAGNWQLRVSAGVDAAGVRVVLTETHRGSRRSAELRLAELVNKAARGHQPAPVTLGEALDEYLAGPLARGTIDKASTALRHLPAHMRRTRLDKLTGRDLERLYRELGAAGVGAPTVNTLHGVIRASISPLVRLGVLDRNAAAQAVPPRVARSRAGAPTNGQLDALVAAASRNQQHALWLRLVMMMGARRAEVLALRWSSIGSDHVVVAGALERDGTPKGTKTARVRTVALDAATMKLIRSWQAVQRARALGSGVPLAADPYLISSVPDSGAPWKPNAATVLFRRLCTRAGVQGVRLHDLRHSAASELLAAGIDPVTVAARLGHQNPRTTLAMYGHVIEGRDRAAAEVLAARRTG